MEFNLTHFFRTIHLILYFLFYQFQNKTYLITESTYLNSCSIVDCIFHFADHALIVFLGGTIDRTMVFCSSAQEQLEWLEHLHAYTKEGSPVGTILKVTLSPLVFFWHLISHYDDRLQVNHYFLVYFAYKPTMGGTSSHHLHSFGTAVANRGPLEPPKITKPWSLSCLRPAPPLKPCAALGYKEVRFLENSHKRSWVGA